MGNNYQISLVQKLKHQPYLDVRHITLCCCAIIAQAEMPAWWESELVSSLREMGRWYSRKAEFLVDENSVISYP